jgi:type I restriction enzyme, S subunit
VKQRDYLSQGRFPVIDQGEALVGGYTNDHHAAYQGPLPVILFGDHTRRFKLVQDRFAVGADGVKILALDEGWDPEFALAQLESTTLLNRGYSRHFQFLRQAEFSRPSLGEQHEVVAALHDELAALLRLRERVDAASAHAASVHRGILAVAFRGELVPQDPNDEPASVLLERITTAGAAPPKATNRRKEKTLG